MAITLEDRVRALEGSRLEFLGRLNACQTMLVDGWLNILLKQSEDPVATAEDMKKIWLRAAENPRKFPGVNPATVDAVSQEYVVAMEHLCAQLLEAAQAAAPKGGKSTEPD